MSHVLPSGRPGTSAAPFQIGWLPQHFGYFPGFTAYDFVRYVAWLRDVPATWWRMR